MTVPGPRTPHLTDSVTRGTISMQTLALVRHLGSWTRKGVAVARTAIISVDGHVRASRAGYRPYIEQAHLDAYDAWVLQQESIGAPEHGGLKPGFDATAQWDSDLRLKELESQRVVAEVLFPNGLPFEARPDDDGAFASPELTRQARLAYNRWLVDFCDCAPGRRAGQALISFDDVDQAVADIRWAKEHALQGVMMPSLLPGGTFFFDPVLDPIWAVCVELDLPISQHGGSGAPTYGPPGFAAIMTLAMEHSFFSGRSLWQLILGGVFDRFPDLRVAFVETEGDWIGSAIRRLDKRLELGDDWTGWAKVLERSRLFARRARDYWADSCYSGISPCTPEQVPLDELARPSGDYEEFAIGCDNAMIGVDFPHFESMFADTEAEVSALMSHPDMSTETTRKILCDTAAKVYNFDLSALSEDIERVGFDLDQY